MPVNRYPVAVNGAFNSNHDNHYTVIFDVLRAVQYGAAFSPAVDKKGNIRGQIVTSGIPANAIVQIRTSRGQVMDPNTLEKAEWDSKGPVDIPSNMPTIKVTRRAEMPSLEVYHAQLSPEESKRWSRKIHTVQVFPEGHLDEQISERGLRKAIPPTGISYAEFVGMRPRTMSQMPFRREGRVIIYRDDKEVEFPEPTQTERGGRNKRKGKGKGKVPLNLIPISEVDQLKLKWEASWNKQQEPHKGTGRSNYGAFDLPTLKMLVEAQKVEIAIENEEDPTKIVVPIPPDEVPVHPSKRGKGSNLKRDKSEHQDSVENKRAKLGGPACMPVKWRNMDPSKMIMSFDMLEYLDCSMMIFFQANSQLPTFGRYILECSEKMRPHRVLDNPMGNENLWAPQIAFPWDVCFRDDEYQIDTADNHGGCALCPGARATELLPCCWCTNWVHLRCSYAVPSGRACASHFDVANPLDKQVVACKEDPLVPPEFKERPVFPNSSIPRHQPKASGV